MAKGLVNIVSQGVLGTLSGQKIYIYGTNDTGKTYQSMKMPKPLLVMAEAGGNAVAGDRQATPSWAHFTALVDALTSTKKMKGSDAEDEDEDFDELNAEELGLTEDDIKEAKKKRKKAKEEAKKDAKKTLSEFYHGKYETIVVDTVEMLVSLCEDAVCEEFGVTELSQISGKANGYSIARKDFKKYINKLCLEGFTNIFLGHEAKEEVKHPLTGVVTERIVPYGTNNEKGSTRFVRDMCDFVFYTYDNGLDEDGEKAPSSALCKATKYAFARSRYACPTYFEPFSAKNMIDTIEAAIEKTAAEWDTKVETWTRKVSMETAEEWVAAIKPFYKALKKKHLHFYEKVLSEELPQVAKLSETTEEDVKGLGVVYNRLTRYAREQGVVLDAED